MEVIQMKIENINVYNFENAIRGMRNPLDSWAKNDSTFNDKIILGDNDFNLAKRLISAGTEHRKFLRQIFVSMDITASLYWWKEFDTYKIGTTANSCSTMHTLLKYPIKLADSFETDDLNMDILSSFTVGDKPTIQIFLDFLESLRLKAIETKDIGYWKELVRWLPEAWLQKRTWTGNYEILMNMYKQRKNHKLTEWHTFCDKILELPYMKEFLDL